VATSIQRAYKALCPNCGGAVEFKSAGSALAVCGYCSSTIARDGETLRNIGKMAELFEDYSPLQIGTAGKFSGIVFTLIGRLQLKYAEGSWNEWYVIFDNGTNGWLSDDNGAYVLSFDVANPTGLPARESLQIGSALVVNGAKYSVAAITEVQLAAAAGELPYVTKVGQPYFVADLRSERGEVLTLDYSANPPHLSVGRSASLADLKLTGLREEADKDIKKSNALNCPNCGAAVEVKLASTKSLTCGSCSSVIDISKGVAGNITAFRQVTHIEPAIPLGSAGKLQGVDWQAVGFQQRKGSDTDGEVFYWQEYLLFNKLQGFKFLVDTSEGWSLVAPLTGAPQFKNPGSGGATVAVNGRTYRETYRYSATVEYVAGEFYWQVKAGQRTDNIDFEAGQWLLSQEKTLTELTYSEGKRVEAAELAKAFKLDSLPEPVHSPDGSPVGGGVSIVTLIVVVLIILVVFGLLARCSDNSSSGYRSGGGYGTSGGSYGGSGGGGGHK
jgi:ribosomal protein S27AE